MEAKRYPGAPPEINSATAHSRDRPAHGLRRFCSGPAKETPREEKERKCPSARPGRQRSLSTIRLSVNSFRRPAGGDPRQIASGLGRRGRGGGKRLSEARPAWRGSGTYSSLAPAALESAFAQFRRASGLGGMQGSTSPPTLGASSAPPQPGEGSAGRVTPLRVEHRLYGWGHRRPPASRPRATLC